MNKKGFTLVELLATIVILGIVVGITMLFSTNAFRKAKEKSEDAFVATIEDALEIYLDYDAKELKEDSLVCTFDKTLKNGVQLKKLKDKNNTRITFSNVIGSELKPILKEKLVNPANKDTDKYQCSDTGTLNVYRDDDFVYYYLIDKSDFGCLNNQGYITNLPCECLNKMSGIVKGKIPDRCK